MKEISDILQAAAQWRRDGVPCALASVVAVEGSAYRRPGARMLIAQGGHVVGGVSGGCIERDVILRAGSVQLTGQPILVKYDTALEAGGTPGQSLGCGGAIDVLIEPISTDHDPLALLSQMWQRDKPAVLATIIASDHPQYELAERFLPDDTSELANAVASDVRGTLLERRSRLARAALVGGAVDVLLEYILPPLKLFIFGAGPDAVPLTRFARLLGWHVTVADMRSATAMVTVDLPADCVIRCHSNQLASEVALKSGAAIVVMTHNYQHDLAALSLASGAENPLYVGVLGPRTRSAELLAKAGISSAGPIFHPVGLHIGAHEPEEVALAIVAEITAVLRSASAGFLRDYDGPIHPRTVDVRDAAIASPPDYSASTCPVSAS